MTLDVDVECPVLLPPPRYLHGYTPVLSIKLSEDPYALMTINHDHHILILMQLAMCVCIYIYMYVCMYIYNYINL